MPLLSLKLGACFLQSVRRGGNSCLSWATVAVKHKLSLCSWGTLGVFPVEQICPPIHTPIHTRFIPRFIPFCCHLQPRASCALGSTSEAMPPKSSEDTKLKEKHALQEPARGSFRRSSPEGGFGRLTAMYQARHGTPPVRGPLASARLPFEDVTLSCPYAGLRVAGLTGQRRFPLSNACLGL